MLTINKILSNLIEYGYINKLLIARQQLAFAKACSSRIGNDAAAHFLSPDMFEMIGESGEIPMTDNAIYQNNNLIGGNFDMEQLFKIIDVMWRVYDVNNPDLNIDFMQYNLETEDQLAMGYPKLYINRILIIIKALRLGVNYNIITSILTRQSRRNKFLLYYMLRTNQEEELINPDFQARWPGEFGRQRATGFSLGRINTVWDRIFFLYIYIYQYDLDWLNRLDIRLILASPDNEDTRNEIRDLLLAKFIELTEQILGHGNGFTGTFEDLDEAAPDELTGGASGIPGIPNVDDDAAPDDPETEPD